MLELFLLAYVESVLQHFPPARRIYSEVRSSSRLREENTYIHFRDLFDELEAGGTMLIIDACRNCVLHVNLHCICHFIILWFSLVDQAVSLADVLVFCSGASSVSPMVFPAKPLLCFSDTAVYPTVSTCALVPG